MADNYYLFGNLSLPSTISKRKVLKSIPEIILFQHHRKFSSFSSSPSPRERIEVRVQQYTTIKIPDMNFFTNF
jgi:hypothetical protein